MLAWDPEYLPRIALVLAKLGVGGPWWSELQAADRQLRAPDLRRPGVPGTNASMVERLAIIDLIIEAHPQVGWKLLVQLLPGLQASKSLTQRPRFREAGASQREPLTHDHVRETYDAVTDRALSLVGSDPEHWNAIAQAFPQFSAERRVQFLEMLTMHVAETAGEERNELRRTLLRIADRHARFPNADWALPASELNRLKNIVAMLESGDPFGQARALFDEWMPFLGDDHAAAERAIEQRRQRTRS